MSKLISFKDAAALAGGLHPNTFRQRKAGTDQLRGKDLACWCKEGAPCHADILLELANQ